MRKTLIAMTVGLAAVATSAAAAGEIQRYTAHLVGGDAAGRIIETNATGQATLEVLDDGSAIKYTLNVAGINNLWMAHIHVSAEPFGNGPPAFWFAPTTPQAGPPDNITERVNGNLASGFIFSPDQLGGVLAGGTVQDLIQAIEEDRAYVVVHTSDLDNSNNMVPGVSGDSPPGELRGQLE